MKTHNFKVGDLVKRNEPSPNPFEYGQQGLTYKVLAVDDHQIQVLPGALGANPSAFDLVKEKYYDENIYPSPSSIDAIKRQLRNLQYQVDVLQLCVNRLLKASKRPRRSNKKLPAKKRSRRANKV